MHIEDHLRSFEEKLLDPSIRRNPEAVAPYLADDFIEFGSSGRIFDKAAVLEDLKNEPPRPASILEDFKLRELSPHTMLVTYRAIRRNLSGETVMQSWRSSIWVHRDQRWQITFHQGTPINTPPPDPK